MWCETEMKMKIRNWRIKVPKTLKKRENFVYYCSSLYFSITCKPCNLKASWHLHLTPLSIIITITQTMNLETQIHKQIEIHKSQIMTFWTCSSQHPFLNRCAKTIDSSEELNFRFCVFLKSIVNWPSYLNFMYVVVSEEYRSGGVINILNSMMLSYGVSINPKNVGKEDICSWKDGWSF